jgi:hypothetical protein
VGLTSVGKTSGRRKNAFQTHIIWFFSRCLPSYSIIILFYNNNNSKSNNINSNSNSSSNSNRNSNINSNNSNSNSNNSNTNTSNSNIVSNNKKYILLFAGNVLQKPHIIESMYCYYSPAMYFLLSTCYNTYDCHPDILSRWTFGRRMFCPAGRFVPPDVLSRRTFCLTDVLSDGRFVQRTLGRWTFFCRTFCPSGRFVVGRFVWALYTHHPLFTVHW